MGNPNSTKLFEEFPPISLEEWEKQIKKDLNAADYHEKLVWEPIGEFPIFPFFRRSDVEQLEHLESKPGQFPYLRGTNPTGNTWIIREPIYAGKVDEANKDARSAVRMGAEGLEFTIKPRPTEGMLGGDLEGTSVQSQQNFDDLLTEINLHELSLYFDTGLSTPAYLAMLSNHLHQSENEASRVNACFSFDPFTYTATHGKWPSKTSQFTHHASRMVDYCRHHLKQVQPLCVNLSPYHYGGGSNVQQLGIAMAIVQEYLARLSEWGCEPADIARCLHFSVPIGTSYFLEIAKLRSLRLLWSRILEPYLPEDTSIPPPTIHAATSQWSHARFDAQTNTVRNTSQAMSAIIGGCTSLAVTPHDATYRAPTSFSKRIARNIQHLMREESHFDRVADPAGGSYYIETLTNELARHAWNFFQEIEKQAGFLKAVEGGYLQHEINRTRQKHAESIASGQTTFVGINNYPNPEDQIEDSTESVFTAFSLTQSDAQPSLNREHPIQSLAKIFNEGALVGDIIDSFIHPTRQKLQTLSPFRGPQPFEQLRIQTEQHYQKTGQLPRIMLIPMGNPKRRKQRANFLSNLLGCGGYELIEPLGFEHSDEAVKQIKEENPDMVIFCAPDDLYPSMVENIIPPIKEYNSNIKTGIAGYPENQKDYFKERGIDYFIHITSNRLKLLQKLHRSFGITMEPEQATLNQSY